jgi:hypothetical protein
MEQNLEAQSGWKKIGRIVVKALLLFAVFNLLFATLDFWPLIGELSIYNSVVPGRQRFPFGNDPERSYNLTTSQLDVMIASHEITGDEKAGDEYRVIIIGDSSVWGFFLQPDETLSAQLDAGGYRTNEGRHIRTYNFGYPTMSLSKDLLLLSRSLELDPDLIVWFFTLESFWRENQIDAPLVQYNSSIARELIREYQLDLDLEDQRFQSATFWQRTIIGQRRELANAIRLQFYAVMWASTGIDRYIPEPAEGGGVLSGDIAFHGLLPGELQEDQMAFDVLAAGVELAGDVPVLLINEPILILTGEGSDLRYNSAYPRWAFDEYRERLLARSEMEGWVLFDLWNLLPVDTFAEGAVHYTADAVNVLASFLVESIYTMIDD